MAQRLEDVENSLLSGETDIKFYYVRSLPARMDAIAPEAKKITLVGIDGILDLSGVTLPPKLVEITVFVAEGGIIWPGRFPGDLQSMFFGSCDGDDILPPAFPETLTELNFGMCTFERLPPLPQTIKKITMVCCPLEECPELPIHEDWKILWFERNGFTRMPESFFKIKGYCWHPCAIGAFDQEWFDSLEDDDKYGMLRLTGGKTKAARA